MFRTRNELRRRSTRVPFPPRRRPGRASVWFRETWPGCRRARPSFFGRYRDHTDPLELQSQVFEELTHLAGTASQAGQLEDAVTGFRHGADRLLLEGFTDRLAIRSHLAFRSIGVPSPQPVQAAVAKRGDIPLDSGPTNPNDLSRLLACNT